MFAWNERSGRMDVRSHSPDRNLRTRPILSEFLFWLYTVGFLKCKSAGAVNPVQPPVFHRTRGQVTRPVPYRSFGPCPAAHAARACPARPAPPLTRHTLHTVTRPASHRPHADVKTQFLGRDFSRNGARKATQRDHATHSAAGASQEQMVMKARHPKLHERFSCENNRCETIDAEYDTCSSSETLGLSADSSTRGRRRSRRHVQGPAHVVSTSRR